MIFFTMVEENFEILWPKSHHNTLISHFLDYLLHHGWRKFWNLMTRMPPKCSNFTVFEWSSSPWLNYFLKFDDLKCLQNILISHYLNDLLHHGWRKFWNLMTWMPPEHFNFTLFGWSSSPWLKKILKFDDLNASKTL